MRTFLEVATSAIELPPDHYAPRSDDLYVRISEWGLGSDGLDG